MEHPHALLMLVLKQHYQNRLHIIDEAKKVIDDYKNDSKPNYEKTLGVLYQLMNDLPPDILLYFLTMVPLPQGSMNNNSTLIELMKQMHTTNLLNNMRPTLLQYLNQVPSLMPLKIPASTSQENKGQPQTQNQMSFTDNNTKHNENLAPVVHSVIDENIKKEKNKNRKKAKAKPRGVQRRTFQVKNLTLLCALNVLKNEKVYKKKYENLKKEAWNLVNNKNINKDLLNNCYSVIRDTNKKIRLLSSVKSGDIPLELIKDEYGSSEIFYQEKHLQNISEDMSLNDALKSSIDNFLGKC